MKTGELVGLVNTGGKPQDLFTKFKNDHGYKFLSVPFDKFDDLYVPSVFTSEDYPGYIKPGEKVEALGVPVVLAVYNWPQGQRPLPAHPALHRILLRPLRGLPEAALSPCLEEHQPGLQGARLDALLGGRGEAQADGRRQGREQAAAPIDTQLARQQAARAAPNDAAEQERLFQRFLEWNKAQRKQ